MCRAVIEILTRSMYVMTLIRKRRARMVQRVWEGLRVAEEVGIILFVSTVKGFAGECQISPSSVGRKFPVELYPSP